jgi:hypothetical protein
MWGFLDSNKEIITNGLDLLSFVLITPELVKFAVPALRFTTTFFMIIAALFLPVLLFVVGFEFQFLHNYIITTVIVTTIGIVCARLLRTIGANAERIIMFLPRHMFVIGCGLFFLSRLLSFCLAIYKNHNLE